MRHMFFGCSTDGDGTRRFEFSYGNVLILPAGVSVLDVRSAHVHGIGLIGQSVLKTQCADVV
ncbi:MAG: hypothetical protein ACTJLK_00875 [Anaplasma sp.]